MRIARALALAGIDSRRKCEAIIVEGLVTVNDETIQNLAFQVDPLIDDIRINGVRIKKQETVFYMLHKPIGYTTTVADRFAKKTVFDLLPRKLSSGNRDQGNKSTRVFPVGRLDRDSAGLLLFTNDGDLSNQLLHPRYGVDKWYSVTLDKPLELEAAQKLMKGVFLEEGKARAEKIKGVGHKSISMLMREGKKREVRRICKIVGYRVMGLTRTAFGPLQLGALPSGQGRFLTQEELKLLVKDVRAKEAKYKASQPKDAPAKTAKSRTSKHTTKRKITRPYAKPATATKRPRKPKLGGKLKKIKSQSSAPKHKRHYS